MKSKDQGKKFDADKTRMDLLSVPALRGISDVLTFGAKKYDEHNWRGGMKWSRLYGAAMRHLTAHMHGENNDPETGLSHLDHALCCLMFLSEYEKTNNGTDDRYKTPDTEPASELERVRETIKDEWAGLLEEYRNKEPASTGLSKGPSKISG